MPDLEDILASLSELFVPIHRDGQRFIAAALVVTLLLFLLWSPLGWLAAGVTAWITYLFRDPDRVAPLSEGLVVAPADGRVRAIDRMAPPGELDLGEELRVRVSIHLSIADVHITRAPVAGVVARIAYCPGTFASTRRPKASEENERRATVIAMASGARVAIVQIAGGLRRRVVGFVEEGARIGIGERIGLIRFGSRVDLYLPPDVAALVAVGQTMIGGETVIANLAVDGGERSARVV